MANKKDIKEGAIFKTFEGRIGTAYAVSKRKIDDGIVDLQFEGGGCVVAGGNWFPPSGMFRIETLTLIENK